MKNNIYSILLILCTIILSCNKEVWDLEDNRNNYNNYDTIHSNFIFSNIKLSGLDIYNNPYDTSINTYHYAFDYDLNSGKLNNVFLYNNSEIMFKYIGDTIKINSINTSFDPRTGLLNNNKLIEMDYLNTKFEYDTNNNLTKKYNDYDTMIFNYQDGNLVKRIENMNIPFTNSVTINYEYYDSLIIKDHQQYFKPLFFFDSEIGAGATHEFQYLDIFGKQNSRLIKSMRIIENISSIENNFTFKWEILDSKITGLRIYNDTTFYSYYKFHY